MLRGIDISHHNEAVILKNPNLLNMWDFIIMKASEGGHYRDSKKDRYLSMVSKYQGIGFYHYARPEKGNHPDYEAANFLSAVGDWIGRAVLALDVEADALLYPDIDAWTAAFCAEIYRLTDVKPLIYCSESACWRFKQAAAMDCGLWCARWGDFRPRKLKIKPWKFWAIWQDSSGSDNIYGIDTDVFNGDAGAWLAYAKGDRA